MRARAQQSGQRTAPVTGQGSVPPGAWRANATCCDASRYPPGTSAPRPSAHLRQENSPIAGNACQPPVGRTSANTASSELDNADGTSGGDAPGVWVGPGLVRASRRGSPSGREREARSRPAGTRAPTTGSALATAPQSAQAPPACHDSAIPVAPVGGRQAVAPSSSAMSSAERTILPAARFCSRWATRDVPGISRMLSRWARSHASPTWAGKAPMRSATA